MNHDLRDVLVEYFRNIGTDGGVEEQKKQRAKVKELLIGLGLSLEDLEEDGEEEAGPSDEGKAPIAAEGAEERKAVETAGSSMAPLPPQPPSSIPLKQAKHVVDHDDMDMDADEGIRTNGSRWVGHNGIWPDFAHPRSASGLYPTLTLCLILADGVRMR